MRFFSLIIFALLLLGCLRSDDSTQYNKIPSKLIGEWKAVEAYRLDVGSPSWHPYEKEEEFIYFFNENGSLKNSLLKSHCNEGSFNISEDVKIKFIFPCVTYEYIIEKLTEDELILDTQNIEVLKYKFVKQK